MFLQIYFIIVVYNKKIENNANIKYKNNLNLYNHIVKKRLAVYIKKNKNAAIKIVEIIKGLIIIINAFEKRNIMRIEKAI